MKFPIGEFAESSGKTLNIDLDVLVSTRLLVQANSGAGKSYTVRRLLEQSHGRVQQIVIDPEGEFSTLRDKFDYVVAAKSGGDTLADPRAAKMLAERLLELRVSAVLDIYELKPTERIEFVRLFCEALVDSPKHLWHPVLVVIDEAHVFCPQGGEASSSIAVRDLCSRGRKRGYCAVLATQRISKLHKDAVAECNNKLIGRSSLDVDMKRAGDELGFAKDRLLELRALKPGEFFAFGPAISNVVTRVKVGPVQTRHPKVGAHGVRKNAAPPPTRKIKALLPKLSDLPAEAEARELTTKELRLKVGELTEQLRQAQRAVPEAKIERVEIEVVKPATVKALTALVARSEALAKSLDSMSARAEKVAQGVSNALHGAIGGERLEVMKGRDNVADDSSRLFYQIIERRKTNIHAVGEHVGAPALAAANAEVAANALPKPEQRILDAIGWLASIGVEAPEQPAVSFLAGYTYGSGAYNNPRGQLKGKGLIEYRPGNKVALTDKGRAIAVPKDQFLTTAELHRIVLERLPKPEQRLLTPLLDAWPKAMDQKDLAVKANYQFGSGAFNNPRGRLKSLSLVDYPHPGQIVARDILFPNARRK